MYFNYQNYRAFIYIYFHDSKECYKFCITINAKCDFMENYNELIYALGTFYVHYDLKYQIKYNSLDFSSECKRSTVSIRMSSTVTAVLKHVISP